MLGVCLSSHDKVETPPHYLVIRKVVKKGDLDLGRLFARWEEMIAQIRQEGQPAITRTQRR
jgi:hypothetical protein